MRKITLEQAKSRYVHRYTCEHVPQWALTPVDDSLYYAPQYESDVEWYNNTYFAGEHELATIDRCYSHSPTWPLGKWLDKPYHKI